MALVQKAMEFDKERGINTTEAQIIEQLCPSDYGFEEEENPQCFESKEACEKCWNREMPNTEPKDEIKERLELIDELKQVEYNKGLNDAWEIVLKIIDMYTKSCEGAFGTYSSKIREEDRNQMFSIMKAFTPQEALAKLKAYEEAQNEIKVGDVITYAGENCLVLDLKGDKVVVLTGDCCVLEWHKCDVEKTGKHIELDGLLEQIN